ncbi:MAG: zinc ribbon domain-containing protein [Bacteroidia bacterium]
MEKITCSNCGIPNHADATFCQACGNKLSKPIKTVGAETKITSKKRIRMIIIAIIIVDLIVGLVVFIAQKNG